MIVVADLLTKQKVTNHFKPDLIRGAPLNPNYAVARQYYENLARLIDKMTEETAHELRHMFHEPHAIQFFAQDASIASQARIITNMLSDKFDKAFAVLSTPLSQQMIEGSEKASGASLTLSLREISGGLTLPTRTFTPELKEVIKASINENVGLIKSIPSQYFDGVQGAVMRSITTGNGLQDLVPFLNKHKMITLERARLIARDQTSKAYANINKNRMIALGLREFEWLHTPGSRYPRHEHILMNGKIYSFDNLPVIDLRTGERGIPGQLIHCNCRMMPVVRFRGE